MFKRPMISVLWLGTVIAVISSVFLLVVMFPSVSNGNPNDVNAVKGKGSSAKTAGQPMIIWYQDPWRDPNIVRLVLKNGIFNHVMLAGMHKFDNPPYYKKTFVRETVRLCKQKGVKVIWTRWLYPGYRFERFKNEDAFDPMYYVLQIRELRKEARALGVDLVAFDAEPNAKATMKKLKHRKLTDDEFGRMYNAIKKAVEIEGAVDFILPAGKTYRNHIYNATRLLGKNVVAEFTYYDRPISSGYSNIPYDIFGAYVNTAKENKEHSNLLFFKPKEILERQYLWADKKGLFVYPGRRKQASSVAIEFSKITSITPVRK